MRYRQKPIEIEARQITEENFEDVAAWCGGFYYQSGRLLTLATPEGLVAATIGDYVIQGVRGEFYPCKESIFNGVYDLVEDEGGH